MKSSILKTRENCEWSISSTLRIRNSKKPSRTRERSWETSVALAMPCKIYEKLWKWYMSESCCKIVLSDDWMTPTVRTFQMRLEPKHTHTSSHQCHTDKTRYYSTECTGTGTGNTDWEKEKQQIVREYADTPPRTRRPWWTWGRVLLQPSCWTLGPDYLQTLCWRVRSHIVDHTSILPRRASSRPEQSDSWFPHALLLHLAEFSAVSVQFCILPISRE